MKRNIQNFQNLRRTCLLIKTERDACENAEGISCGEGHASTCITSSPENDEPMIIVETILNQK